MLIKEGHIRESLRFLRECWEVFKGFNGVGVKRLNSVDILIKSLVHELPQMSGGDIDSRHRLELEAYTLIDKIAKYRRPKGESMDVKRTWKKIHDGGCIQRAARRRNEVRCLTKSPFGPPKVTSRLPLRPRKQEEEVSVRRARRKRKRAVLERLDKSDIGKLSDTTNTESAAEKSNVRTKDGDDSTTIAADGGARDSLQTLVEAAMCLKDQLLWYEPEVDFDEDLLP